MSQFIGFNMRRGFAGEITRGAFDYTTEIKPNDGSTPVVAFGVPVMYNGDKSGVVLGTTYNAIIGFAVREYGQANTSGEYPGNMVTIMKRGYMAVAIDGGTPAPGGTVYVKSSGAISAASTSANAISGAYFTGEIDGDGLAEIAYNI